MSKSMTNLLHKTNLTGKERVLLYVNNQVSEERDGKGFLTEADKEALVGSGWTPKENIEIREYNRYNEGWRLAGFAESDAQTTTLLAENSLLRAGRLVDMAWLGNEGKPEELLKSYERLFKTDGIDEGEALDLILKNSGLEKSYVIYRQAFNSLSEELKKDILALDPNAETERQYLEQEETLASLFNGKAELTKADKNKLADLIVDTLYNAYSKEWRFNGFYASLPSIEIAKRWADFNKISYELSDSDLEEAETKQLLARNASQLIAGDKSFTKEQRKKIFAQNEELAGELLLKRIKAYAETHKADIGELLKQTILKWLDEGLFVKEYQPIFNSETLVTCNGETKLTHKEVFSKWLEAKGRATATILELLEKGELKQEERVRELRRVVNMVGDRIGGKLELDDKDPFKIKQQLLTGESLYNLKGDYIFARDYRNQVSDLKVFGSLILFLRKQDFIKKYADLLAFEEIFRKLSKTYETDLTYKTKGWIADFKEQVSLLNIGLASIEGNIREASRTKHKAIFSIDTFESDLNINLEGVEPSDKKTYTDKLKGVLGEDF